MYKVFPHGGQDELVRTAGRMLTVYESGRHIKQAASPLYSRSDLESYAPPKGKFMTHIITMGSGEKYGENRNCLPAGEPVRTPTGYRPVEAVETGDLVLSGSGNWKKVSRTYERKFTGMMVKATASWLGLPVTCTAEHPLLALRSGKEDYVEAHVLRPGDWLGIRIREEAVTDDRLQEHPPWFLGLFLSKGGPLLGVGDEFVSLCGELFGEDEETRDIATPVFGMPDDWILDFLAGWADGGGSVHRGFGGNRGTLSWTLGSANLAMAGQRLMASAGIPAKALRDKIRGCYRLEVPPSHSDRILSRCKLNLEPHGETAKAGGGVKIRDGVMWVRIKKVAFKRAVDVTVHNLEVEDDHTYQSRTISHNCDFWPHEELLKKHATFETHALNYREHDNKDPSKALGTIKSARYCPDLERGEILMWTDIDKAPEEFEKARAGEEQSGSMACSVEHDKCSGCGFISKTPAQRCDHILNTPGRWIPKLKKYAVMINVNPVFKDYSWVKRPADRIAHYLNYLLPDQQMKMASTGEPAVLRGDQLAEIYGIGVNQWSGDLAKIAEFDSRSAEPAKQAMIENVLPFAFDGEFGDDLLEKMAKADPGKVMKGLVDRRMAMPLASFNSWITGKAITTSLNDPVVKEASAKMAASRVVIMTKLDNEAPFSAEFDRATGEFNPAGCSDDVVDAMMDKATGQFSTRYELLSKRAAWNQPSSRIVRDTSPLSDEAFALSTLYQAYLVKTASLLDEGDWVLPALLASLR